MSLVSLEFIAGHHSVTASTPLADVVVACACTPGVQRDSRGWAAHLLEAILGASTSGAEGASDGQAPDEEAGACHVIPINRNT